MVCKSRFFLESSLLLLISFLVIFFLFPVGGQIDLNLIQPWVSSDGSFPLKGDWALAKLNHTYVKQVLTAVYLSFFVLWCASFKIEKLKAKRWQYGYFFAVSMLCTCVIGLIKAHAAHACPWAMTTATSTGFIWNFSATAGHCFPGGHASTGFALITGFFIFRLDQKKLAWFYLFSALILGFAMGWAQMMRGAHFLSHNLWTAWICMAINLLCYALSYRYHLAFAQRNSVPQDSPNVLK